MLGKVCEREERRERNRTSGRERERAEVIILTEHRRERVTTNVVNQA